MRDILLGSVLRSDILQGLLWVRDWTVIVLILYCLKSYQGLLGASFLISGLGLMSQVFKRSSTIYSRVVEGNIIKDLGSKVLSKGILSLINIIHIVVWVNFSLRFHYLISHIFNVHNSTVIPSERVAFAFRCCFDIIRATTMTLISVLES